MDDDKLVYVSWIDAVGCAPSWEEIRDAKAIPHKCYSVGWIVDESPEAIVVVPHYSPENKAANIEEQGCGHMTIPKVAILYILSLEKKEP